MASEKAQKASLQTTNKKKSGNAKWRMQQGTSESDEARSNAKRSKESGVKYKSSFEQREYTVVFIVGFSQSFTAGRRFQDFCHLFQDMTNQEGLLCENPDFTPYSDLSRRKKSLT